MGSRPTLDSTDTQVQTLAVIEQYQKVSNPWLSELQVDSSCSNPALDASLIN